MHSPIRGTIRNIISRKSSLAEIIPGTAKSITVTGLDWAIKGMISQLFVVISYLSY